MCIKKPIIVFLLSIMFATVNIIDNKINELQHKANIQLQLGNYAIVVQFYKQIIHLQEKTYGSINIELAKSTNKFGEILFDMGEIEMARIYFDKSIQIYEDILQNEQKLLLQSLINIKNIYEIEQQFELIQYTDSLIESISINNGPYKVWGSNMPSRIFTSDTEEDSSIVQINKAIFYLENNLYSQSAYYFSEGFLIPSNEVTLGYLANIEFGDSTKIDKLISSFTYMHVNDTLPNASLFYLSLLEMKNNNISKSKDYLISYIMNNKSDYRPFLLYGDIMFKEGKWFEALFNYQSSLLNKSNIESYLGIGKCLIELESYTEALIAFNNSLKLDNEFHPAYYYSGICHINLFEYKKAIKELTHALMLNPSYTEIYYYLGLAYMKTNNKIRALDALKRAINIDPENGNAYFLMGDIYENSLEIEKSIINYLLAKKFIPQNKFINYNLGMLYFRSDQLKLAMEPLREFIILNPDSTNVLIALGEIFISEDRYPEAIDTYKRLIAKFPDNVNYYEYIAQSYTQLNQYHEAYEYYKNIISLDNERLDIYYYLGDLSLKRYQINDALYYYHESIDCGVESFDVYYQLGITYGTIQNYEEAINFFNKARQIDNNKIIDYQIGVAYYELGMYELSSKHLHEYILDYSNDYLALYYLGNCYFNLKQHEKSNIYLYNSYKINDNDNRVKFLIGLNHKNLEEYNDAAKFFKKILKENPNDIKAKFELGLSYYRLNKKRESKKILNSLYMLDRSLYDSLNYHINESRSSN